MVRLICSVATVWELGRKTATRLRLIVLKSLTSAGDVRLGMYGTHRVRYHFAEFRKHKVIYG